MAGKYFTGKVEPMKGKAGFTLLDLLMHLLQVCLCVIAATLLKKLLHLSWLVSILLGVPAGIILTWGSVFLAVFALNVFQRDGK